jgi:hypothetical protein
MVEPKTIYLEPDEEVTSVIDKLRKTEFKDVVLVVPKEAGLLHSIVNLKLIKRQSETLEKNVSLVTQDKVGRNLAEKVGLPTAAKVGQVPTEPEEQEIADFAAKQKPEKESENPIEETNEIVYKKKPKEEPIIEGPNEVVVREDEDTEAEADFHKKELKDKEPGNLMPKLPKKKLIIAIAAVLIVLLGLGFIYLPRAQAVILVQAEKKPVSMEVTGEKEAKLDTDKAVVPTKSVEVTKEKSKKYSATGKKDVGNKASGSLQIVNLGGTTWNWVAGTRFSPTNNSSIVFRSSGSISAAHGLTTILVTADQPGDQYNGFGNFQEFNLVAGGLPAGVSVSSTQSGMTGGNSRQVTYVTQGDYTAAKDNLSKEALTEATSEFNKQTSELKVIENSKKESVVSASSDPAAGEEGSDFNVNVKVSVTALAVSLADIEELIKAEVKRQYGAGKDIIDDGAGEADLNVTTQDSKAGTFAATVKTNAYLAAKMDQDQIKGELVGTNATKATNYLQGLEGVDNVKLDFWPSFLKIFPRLKNHIFIKIQVADKVE